MDEADRHRLTAEQHERIFQNRIVPQLTAHAQPTAAPRAVILGGQPGAGKSALQSEVERELAPEGGALAIVGDDLRAYHPKYRALLRTDDKHAAFYTDRDSAGWIEKLIDYAKLRRFNVLIESTMRRPDKIVATAATLRAHGYQIEARALAVHECWSMLGIHQRYEAMLKVHGRARFALQEAHDAAYVGMRQTLAELESGWHVDRIAIYARGNVALYDNTCRSTGWIRTPGACQAVEAERARPWTAQEKVDYWGGWQRLFEARRDRTAGEDLSYARAWRNRALVDVVTDPAARANLAQRLSAPKTQAVERIAAAAVFELLPQAQAQRIFPALAAYFAERQRLAPITPTQLERLSSQIAQTFPEPPKRERSRGRGR